MPYIDVNITNKLTEEEKNNMKSKLGELICIIPGKREASLMVGINDGYTIYLGGEKKEKSAFIMVNIFRNADFEEKAKFTEKVFEFFEEEFDIAKDDLYLNISECEYWGAKGKFKK